MEEPSRSLPILLVYWFLAGIALVCAFFTVRNAVMAVTQVKCTAQVLERAVRVEVRAVTTKRNPYQGLFAVTPLKFLRLDTHQTVSQTEERMITKDEFISLQFLDKWKPGSTLSVAVRSGEPATLNLEPSTAWLAVLGPGIAAWMFGCFAWLAKPVAEGRWGDRMGIKMPALAVLPILAAVVPLTLKFLENRQQPVERVPVEGRTRSVKIDELIPQVAALGGRAGEDVRRHFGEDSLSYCEYSYGGKTWRTTSLWCQPPEGEACPGLLNPNDPRDVKWGSEP